MFLIFYSYNYVVMFARFSSLRPHKFKLKNQLLTSKLFSPMSRKSLLQRSGKPRCHDKMSNKIHGVHCTQNQSVYRKCIMEKVAGCLPASPIVESLRHSKNSNNKWPMSRE